MFALEKGWMLHGVVASMLFPVGEGGGVHVSLSLTGARATFMGAVESVGPAVFPVSQCCWGAADGCIRRVHHGWWSEAFVHGEFLLVAELIGALELFFEAGHCLLPFGEFLPVSNVADKDSTLLEGGKDCLYVLFV